MIYTGHAFRSAIAHGDHAIKIVHCAMEFKVRPRAPLRPEALKNHLISETRGALALLGVSHGPGQERQAKNVARDPWRRRRQIIHPISDEMRPGAERMPEMQHALALRR
jgi:hypothetical protein